MGENPKLQLMADRVQRLPTLPTVYMHVTQLMNDPNSSAAEIGEVVSHDQVITAKILSVVNSSFYGFKQRISTVTRAMTMIGFRGLKELILAVSVLPALNTRAQHPAFDDSSFWTHAIGCAAGAKAAARLLRLPSPEEVFTGGLLHDIGRVAEYQCLQEEFLACIEEAHAKNVPLHEVERERFGFTHADVGQMLARKWQFPDNLLEAIAYHHTPNAAVRCPRETAIVHLADIIARAKILGSPYDQRVPPLNAQAWEATGLKRNQLEALMQTTDEEFEKGQAFISIVKEA